MCLLTQITMSIISRYCLVLALALCSSLSFAHGEQKHADMMPPDNLAISVAFDAQGKLWRVRVKEGFVEISSSEDLGKNFSKPLRVNPAEQKVTAHGESRPKIAIGLNGEIYVAWVQNLPARFSGYIWFARSINGGKSFGAPYIVHQDRAEISHAFQELAVASDGRVTVVWLDARDFDMAKKNGKSHVGSSVYYAVSENAGQSFSQEQKLTDGSCECCRIALAVKPDNTVVALFRYVFEGSERDHMIAEIPVTSAKSPKLTRASYGRWQVDGCPHHGAAIATGGEGKDWWGYHIAYFDGNDKKPGLYYSRVDGEAWAISPPKKFGNHAKQAAHPALMSIGEKVWLVWRELNAEQSQIMGMTSDDGGRSWSEVKVLMRAAGNTDYPQLLAFKAHGYLVWNTPSEGLNITALQ
jgi:hypothetical protein